MLHIYYIHDPMCSWCWGFRPTFEKFLRHLPSELSCSRLLGGLATDSTSPMPEEMRIKLEATWREIEQRIPNTRFNFDFWVRNTPRRSTYPACRAVIATRILDPAAEERMILAIQQAYYLEARNPSDDSTLAELALEIGLNRPRFIELLNNHSTQQVLESEITQAQRMGVRSFPSLVLQIDQSLWPVAIDYLRADPMLEQITNLLGS
ncbi:MAG: DsbA family protein [Candidatus Thiodiazotropha sp.]